MFYTCLLFMAKELVRVGDADLKENSQAICWNFSAKIRFASRKKEEINKISANILPLISYNLNIIHVKQYIL